MQPNTSIETANPSVPATATKPNGPAPELSEAEAEALAAKLVASKPKAQAEAETASFMAKVAAEVAAKAKAKGTVTFVGKPTAKAATKGKAGAKRIAKAATKGKAKTRATASPADLAAIEARGKAYKANPAFKAAMKARRARAKANGGTYTGGGAPLPDLPREAIVTIVDSKAFNAMGPRAKGVRTGQTVNKAVQTGMKGFHGRRNFLRKAMYAGLISVK